MNFRYFSLPQIWGILSRTRPFTPSPRQRPIPRTSRGLCNVINGGFWYFIYQGMGVTAPFGICYVVGVVVEDIGGEGISTAVLVAMLTSLLTGLCYAELITSNRHCCGNAVTAIYQLVGEFPSYITSVLNVLVSCSCFAAMSKALSSTMEELSHQRLSLFLAQNVGTLPLSGLPPDILAFGATLVTSVLLACGLKQAGILRTAMNLICVGGFFFFLGVGGSHTRSTNSKFIEKESGPRQVLAGVGVCCCLFYQYLELGRRSKNQPRQNVRLPLAVSVTTAGVMVASLSLGVVLSLMMDNRLPVSGAPLLRAFQLRDVGWARLLMGSIQVIIIGLGISESGEFVCRSFVTMASEGFILPFLSMECPLAFSYSRAHLLGGVSASVLALCLTHVFLLQFMASNILLANIVIALIMLYRPYRCSYDSLCTVAVTPSSRPGKKFSHSSRLKLNSDNLPTTSNPQRTLHFLKTGIGVLAFKKSDVADKDDELGIPLLSSLHSANQSDGEEAVRSTQTNKQNRIVEKSLDSEFQRGAAGDALGNYSRVRTEDLLGKELQNEIAKDSAQGVVVEQDFWNPNEERKAEPNNSAVLMVRNTQDVSSSVQNRNCVKMPSDLDSNDSELLSLNDSPSSNDESEADTRHLEDTEEDIDTIVSEYKEQLRIATLGSKIRRYPTKETARKAFLLILTLTMLSFLLSYFSQRFTVEKDDPKLELTSTLRIIFFLVNVVLIFIVIIVLARLPTVSSSSPASGNGFRLPGSPWIAFIALFLNVFILTEIISRTIWSLLPLYVFAVVWYAVYTSRHSGAANMHFYSGMKSADDTGKENEMVCLAPVLPATFYASQPQREELTLNRNV